MKPVMTNAELIKKYKLHGRFTRFHTREYTPLLNTDLMIDLRQMGVDFTTAFSDNNQHPDFGKPILVFTLFGDFEENKTPAQASTVGKIIGKEAFETELMRKHHAELTCIESDNMTGYLVNGVGVGNWIDGKGYFAPEKANA